MNFTHIYRFTFAILQVISVDPSFTANAAGPLMSAALVNGLSEWPDKANKQFQTNSPDGVRENKNHDGITTHYILLFYW